MQSKCFYLQKPPIAGDLSVAKPCTQDTVDTHASFTQHCWPVACFPGILEPPHHPLSSPSPSTSPSPSSSPSQASQHFFAHHMPGTGCRKVSPPPTTSKGGDSPTPREALFQAQCRRCVTHTASSLQVDQAKRRHCPSFWLPLLNRRCCILQVGLSGSIEALAASCL